MIEKENYLSTLALEQPNLFQLDPLDVPLLETVRQSHLELGNLKCMLAKDNQKAKYVVTGHTLLTFHDANASAPFSHFFF